MPFAPKRRWSFSLRTLFVVTGIVAMFLGFVVAVRQMFPEGPRGPVENRDEWPQPMQDILAKAAIAHIDVEPVQVYCIHDFTERY